MPKPSSPRRAPRNAPQPNVHRYVDALFTDDFDRPAKLTIQAANVFARKKLDAASQALQIETERAERKAIRASDRDYRRAERELQAELREADHRWRKLFRRISTAIRPEKTIRHTPPRHRQRLWPHASVALPHYDGPILDRKGERGVFARFRYYSRRTARQGVSQRVTLYVFHGAEVDADGTPYAVSNVGLTIDETLCAFDHLEQVNWAAAKNAKLLMHGILAVDHRQMPDEMMECGERWAEETLGRFGLPYLVALHAPPEDGDQRNWHIHVLWSFRPMERIGDHEWIVGEMLRTDLDNPQAMKLMREMFAAVMTDVSFEAGQKQVWTAKSNAARGIVEEPQVHLDAAQTNRAREGEFVPANEENHERVMRSKAARLEEELRHVDEALVRQQGIERAVEGRWARRTYQPIGLPQRVAASIVAAELPETREPVARATASIAVPSRPVPIYARRASPIEPLAEIETDPPARAGTSGIPISGRLASARPQPAAARIANLRISVAQNWRGSIARPGLLPSTRLVAPIVPALPALTFAPMTSTARRIGISPSLPVRATASAPTVPTLAMRIASQADRAVPSVILPRLVKASTIPSLASVPLPMPAAGFEAIDRALDRIEDAVDREKAQRDDEGKRIERQDALVAEDERRRRAQQELFAAILHERHHLTRKDGRPSVEPALLARFGLDRAALADADSERRLDEIVIRQNAEISKIASYVRASPQELRFENGRWTLDADADAPADVRALVEAWRNDRTMQAALEREARKAPAYPVEDRSVEQTAWQRARMIRERAMAEGDDAERRGGNGLSQPGRQVDRPGAGHDAQPDKAFDTTRRIPPPPGAGLGD